MPETTHPPKSTAKPVPPSGKPPRPATRKRRSWSWLKGLFWLLVIAGLAAGGYWVGMQVLAREAELVGQLERQRGGLAEQRAMLDEQRGQLQSLLRGEAEREANLQEQLAAARALTVEQLKVFTGQLDALREAQQPGNHRLRLMAVEWLVLGAHTHNTLRLDPALAVDALEIADQQLRALPSPEVASLRHTLAGVQAELATVAEFDLTGISVELAVLGERADGLTLPVRRLPELESAASAPDEAGQSIWWRMWRDFRAMIVVEKRTAEVDLLLLPELGQVLRQRIGLSLDFAQEALLRRDQQRYRAHLDALDALVRRHFASSPETDAWLKQVQALKARPITLPAVSFDALLEGLRELRAKQSR